MIGLMQSIQAYRSVPARTQCERRPTLECGHKQRPRTPSDATMLPFGQTAERTMSPANTRSTLMDAIAAGASQGDSPSWNKGVEYSRNLPTKVATGRASSERGQSAYTSHWKEDNPWKDR